MLQLSQMNAQQTIIHEREPGDTDAKAEAVGEGVVIMVAGRRWFVDLADLMEERIPGMTCGHPLDELTLAQ